MPETSTTTGAVETIPPQLAHPPEPIEMVSEFPAIPHEILSLTAYFIEHISNANFLNDPERAAVLQNFLASDIREVLVRGPNKLNSKYMTFYWPHENDLPSHLEGKHTLLSLLSYQLPGNTRLQQYLWEITSQAQDDEIRFRRITMLRDIPEGISSGLQEQINQQFLLERLNVDTPNFLRRAELATLLPETPDTVMYKERFHLYSPESIHMVANELTEELLQKAPESCRPLLYLFIRRHMIESKTSNQIFSNSREDLINTLRQKTLQMLHSYSREIKESNENPYLPTVGVELQGDNPGSIPPANVTYGVSRETHAVKFTKKDYQKLAEQAGLLQSPDDFWEFAIPPTKSAAIQAATIAELYRSGMITGKVAYHINLGGVLSETPQDWDWVDVPNPSDEKMAAFLMQMIYISSGQMISPLSLFQPYNNVWAIKGPIKRRWIKADNLLPISGNPSKAEVTELRILAGRNPVDLYKATYTLQHLGSLVKAYQIPQNQRDTVEIGLAATWEQMVAETRSQLLTFPGGFDITEPWTQDTYEKLADLLEADGLGDSLVKNKTHGEVRKKMKALIKKFDLQCRQQIKLAA